MSEKKEIGNEGEHMVAKYLLKNGFEIRHTNWRFRKYELDIVAVDKKILVFVEVKTRNRLGLSSGVRAIHRKKREGMLKAANAYVEKYNTNLECRFDVVTVFIGNTHPEIIHYINAFVPRP